jgi:hypothetical protein
VKTCSISLISGIFLVIKDIMSYKLMYFRMAIRMKVISVGEDVEERKPL